MAVKALGRHILAEMYDCQETLLDNVQQVEEAMVSAALGAGAEIREVAFHKFSPHGVSGVVVISESHLAIHTWPELGYAAVDIFTCGETVDPWHAYRLLVEAFGPVRVTATEVRRGMFEQLPKIPIQVPVQSNPSAG